MPLGIRQFYVPVDISQQQLAASVDAITRAIPGISVKPVCADFTTPFKLPADVAEMNRMGFFPGSTIGNFTPSETHRFLASRDRHPRFPC